MTLNKEYIINCTCILIFPGNKILGNNELRMNCCLRERDKLIRQKIRKSIRKIQLTLVDSGVVISQDFDFDRR